MSSKNYTFLFLIAWVLSYSAQTINKDSVRFEVLLSKTTLKSANKEITFINEFEITPKKYALLANENQFYLLSWGKFIEAGTKTVPSISSYAYSSDSVLFVVRNNELCAFDSTGTLNKLYTLPNKGMGISCGEKVIYLYDRIPLNNKYSIYGFTYGGNYFKIIEQNKPINNVIELDNFVIFSSENFIYQFNIKTKEIKTIISFTRNDQIITSLTANKTNKRIYFSTKDGIYSVKDTTKDVITDKFSGKLKYFDNGLVVFDSEKQLLVRIVNIEKILHSNRIKENKNQISTIKSENSKPVASSTPNVPPVVKPTPTVTTNPPAPQKEIITNASIIKMSKAKLSDELIIDVIKTSEVNFDLKVESMVNLSNSGVSSTVIKEMKTAMEKKNNK